MFTMYVKYRPKCADSLMCIMTEQRVHDVKTLGDVLTVLSSIDHELVDQIVINKTRRRYELN